MVGCTIASGPYMIYMQYDNYVKLDERKGSSIFQRREPRWLGLMGQE